MLGPVLVPVAGETSGIEPLRHLSRPTQIRRLREAGTYAVRQFGVEATSIHLIAHFYNTTFRVESRTGERLVLHVLLPEDELGSADRGPRVVESELWWMEHVRRELRLTVPEPVRTLEGNGVVWIDVSGMSGPRLCTLFRWVGGRFRKRSLSPAHLEAVGRLTARLHRSSERLAVPSWFDREPIGATTAERAEAVVRTVTDRHSPDAGHLLERVYRYARRTQEEIGRGADVFGLIHADIHQKNYLFHRGDVRLIDFGDCGWGHYLYDPATTSQGIRKRADFPGLRAAYLAGYRELRELSPTHEVAITAFLMMRDADDLAWLLEERDNPALSAWTAHIDAGLRLLARDLAEADR